MHAHGVDQQGTHAVTELRRNVRLLLGEHPVGDRDARHGVVGTGKGDGFHAAAAQHGVAVARLDEVRRLRPLGQLDKHPGAAHGDLRPLNHVEPEDIL